MNLCIALMQKQSWDEAIAAAREAIRCKPDLPEAHCNLGHALQKKGQLREALEALQRGHELGIKIRTGGTRPLNGCRSVRAAQGV